MQSDLPQEAYHLVSSIERKLGTALSISDLLAYVSKERSKEIIVEELLIHAAYLGLCFSFTNCDLIIIAPGLSKRLYLITLLHELMHILRNEAKHYDKPYDRLMHDLVLSCNMMHRDADTFYEGLPEGIRTKEDIAESTATLLFEYVWKHEESIPAIVQRIYGYRE